MQAANQAQETAASVSDALTELQGTLVGLCMADPAQLRLDLDALCAQLTLIASAAEQSGARGLPNVTLRLVERLLPLKRNAPPAMDVAGALEEWTQLAFAYLESPADREGWHALIEFLDQPLWNEQLSQGQIAILQRLFEIDSTPAPAVALVSSAPPASLDDRNVAVLLDVTGAHAAQPALGDGEATVLAPLSPALLAQLEAAAAATVEPAADEDVFSSNEPTVQVSALVLDDAVARALQIVAEADAAEVIESESAADGDDKDSDADFPSLPAAADSSAGWDAVAHASPSEPAPIAALPGAYEGTAPAAVWVEETAEEISYDSALHADVSPGSASSAEPLDSNYVIDVAGSAPPLDDLGSVATVDSDAYWDTADTADFVPALPALAAVETDSTEPLESDYVIGTGSAPLVDDLGAAPALAADTYWDESEHADAVLPSAASAVAVWTESVGVESVGAEEIELAASREATAGLPPAVAELIVMIHEELNGCMEALSGTLESAATAALTGGALSLEDYRWQVERLSSAAQSIGLQGLHEFLSRVLEASCLVESAPANDVPTQCEVLDRWPTLVGAYLQPLANEAASHALIEYISSQEFAMPLDADTAASLLIKLSHPEIEIPAAAVVTRAQRATPADVSLAVPQDIHPDLLDSLLHELPAQTQEFSGALQRVAAGTGGNDDIRVAQRIAHTLKGSANTVGIRGIAELSHHLEDIFLALEQHEVLPPPALARTLVDAADCLEAMSEALLGVGPAPGHALQVLQDVLDWANRIDAHGIADAAAQVDAASHEIEPATEVESAPVAAAEASTEAPAPAAAAQADASAPTLRVASTQVDDLLRLSGESRIVGGQLKEGVRRLEQQLQAVKRQNQLFQQLVGELEQLVDVRGVTMPMQQRRAEYSEFDALEMDQYSELHTVSRRLTEAATDAREWSAAAQTELRTLEELLRSQSRHGNDSQESILKMRMVPASTIVGRLQRGVRQTCRLLDKEVALDVRGEQTLVDSDTLNQLVDPLMHLMRNAIDHGIEAGEQRVANGKSSQGHLTIEFGREGNQIFVRCADDGKGLDYGAIRATAIKRGLITADAVLTDSQLARLILEPGFSTRTEVTQTSGRGIGLDIVHSRVLELKGTFDVQSVAGRGCRFVIRLPATLLSAHALLVRQGEHTVAVASRGVRQIIDSHACKVSMLGTRMTVQVGQEIYEAHQLHSLLGNADLRTAQTRGPQPALLVEVSADRLCAVLVQGVVDTIDLVIKPLGEFVPRSVGVVGATILGDGSVAAVVDLPDLLRVGALSAQRSSAGRVTTPAPSKLQLPTVLVVDDSLSVRRSMEQLLRDSGYDVQLARDGMEAVAMIETRKPDLLLVDLEMPRMNGMELTAHVRNRADTRALPVIMITSRSTDKHRKQAEAAGVSHYMTKPFTEDTLLAQMSSLLKRSA